MREYIKLIRPHHYVKNILIFLPLVFSGQLFKLELLIKSIIGVLSFCLICSVVYIMNDIKDIEFDRHHTTKCNRPIASGAIAPSSAIVLAVLFLLISTILNAYFNNKIEAWIILILYFAINVGYSIFGLKHIPLVDIIILVTGFILRVFFGSVITNILISNWLYLTVIAISFYCSLGKRRNEIKCEEPNCTRRVLKRYNQSFLDKNMYMCLTLAIVFYSLWCVDPGTIAHHKNSNAIWTVPLILILAIRYSMIIENNSDGDPVEVIIKDKVLLILGLIYVVCMCFIIYGI